MVPGDVIKELMGRVRVNQATLAKIADLPGQSTVSACMRRDMRMSTFIRLANAMGYDVIVRERTNWSYVAQKSEITVTTGPEEATGDS